MAYKRQQLTNDQVQHVRAKLMASSSQIVKQLDQYVNEGKIVVAGKEIELNSARLNAYKLVLDKCVPNVSHQHVTREDVTDNMSSDDIIKRLAKLASKRPDLQEKLMDVIGPKVISGVTVSRDPSDACREVEVPKTEYTLEPRSAHCQD